MGAPRGIGATAGAGADGKLLPVLKDLREAAALKSKDGVG